MKRDINIYLPLRALVEEIVPLAGDVRLYKVRTGHEVSYSPGQFFMLSLWGRGEVPISIASEVTEKDLLEFCVRKAGFVTSGIASLNEGEHLWLRGPYGNGFPAPDNEGDIIIVAGGIGIAPLRPLIQGLARNGGRRKGKVALLYGAKTPGDILFKDDLHKWREKGIDVSLTVDLAGEGWEGNVCLVTGLCKNVSADFPRATAYVCGPPVMIHAALGELSALGVPGDRAITTLEAHMKCGVGKCGHCYAGPKYICTDGPVFSHAEIKRHGIPL